MEKKNVEIKIENAEMIAPLYLQYGVGQCQPQPAYIEIDPRGEEIEINAKINHNIGPSCSQDQFMGVVWTIPCNPYVLGSELSEYLNSEDFKEKVVEMCLGNDCKWDGSNWRGSWNEDARYISNSIEMDMMSLDGVEIFDGDEWIEESVKYYDEDGNDVYRYQAIKAIYEMADGKLVEITRENIKFIASDAKKFVDQRYQLVEGIEDALSTIVENLEENRE